MAAKLVRKKCKKPKGKSLSAHPDVLRNSPFALAAFVGQLVRTSAALQEAGLAELAQPMLAHFSAADPSASSCASTFAFRSSSA